MWATWRLTDDMKVAKRHNPGIVCSCNNCTWHYPPQFEEQDGSEVWCQAWDNHVKVKYLCKRWDLDTELCLIQAPLWAAKRPKRRII